MLGAKFSRVFKVGPFLFVFILFDLNYENFTYSINPSFAISSFLKELSR